jgi:hypothetical protein
MQAWRVRDRLHRTVPHGHIMTDRMTDKMKWMDCNNGQDRLQ